MEKRPHPILLATLIGVMVAAWSLNFIVGKIALRHFPPVALAVFRVELAGLLMVPIYLLFRPRSGERPGGVRGFGWSDFWTFGWLGFLGVVVNQVCFTIGLNYTTVGHSALIIGAAPILVLLLAWLQGLEALTLQKAFGMALAFLGVIIVAAEHGLSLRSATLRGDLITFTGTTGLVLYTVYGKKVAAAYDSISMNSFNYFVGAILVLPIVARQAERMTREGNWSAVGWQGWAALGFMTGCASIAAYLIYFWVLRYMAASRLAAFSYIHPVLTTLLGVALLGERLTPSLLLGGALVLAGVYRIESGREAQREAKV